LTSRHIRLRAEISECTGVDWDVDHLSAGIVIDDWEIVNLGIIFHFSIHFFFNFEQ
jgi:hypothetical protein